MRIVPISIAVSAAFAATAGLSAVSGTKAKRISHERHEGMESIGKAFKVLHREFDSPAPNAATVKLRQSGGVPGGQVVLLVRQGLRRRSRQDGRQARDLADWPDFVAKNRAFQQSAQAFRTIAAQGDMTAAKASYADLAGTCKACHEKYRMEKHH